MDSEPSVPTHFTFRSPSARWAASFEDTHNHYRLTRAHALKVGAEWWLVRGLLKRLEHDPEAQAGFGPDLEEAKASLRARLEHIETAAHPGPDEQMFTAFISPN